MLLYFVLLLSYTLRGTAPLQYAFGFLCFFNSREQESERPFYRFNFYEITTCTFGWMEKILSNKRRRNREEVEEEMGERERESLMRFSWIINVYAFAIGFTKIAHTCTTTHTHTNFHRDTGRAFIISHEWNTFPDTIEIHLVIHENKFI